MNWKYCFLLCVLLISNGCKWEKIERFKPKFIVCTTTIVGDMVRQLVGNRYEVKTLMKAGVDPHMYEPKPSDVRALGEAQVIVLNGLHLEGKMTDLFNRLKHEKHIVEFADGMDKSQLIAVNEHSFDPHVWFDVHLWLQGTTHCYQQLRKIFPADSSFFDNNYLLLKKKLVALESEVKAEIERIPLKKRVLITSHDAFHYFGKAYRIDVKALQGISTVAEPSLRNVSNLVNLITRRQIPVIFIESSISPKAIKSVLEGCKQKDFNVKIGGMLYSDALGGLNSHADTYIKMIRKNCKTLSHGLNQ